MSDNPDIPKPTAPKADQEDITEETSFVAKSEENKPPSADQTEAPPTEETNFLPQPVPPSESKQNEKGASKFDDLKTRIMSDGGGTCKALVCCLASVGIVLAVIVACVCSGLHTIGEGNIGIYYKYGALMEETTEPGMHYMQPFFTTVKEVMIRPDTRMINNIEAITKDGIQIKFQDVQVINRVREDKLIYILKRFGDRFKDVLVSDRVREEIRLFCANHTIDDVYNIKFLEIVKAVRVNIEESITRLGEGGIVILNLVIPKPDIPADIANNYKQVKVQWTEQLVASQRKKTEEIKKETEEAMALADARRKKSVLEITIQEKIMEREGEQNVSRITNSILKEKEENLANIEKYRIESEAEANKKLYSGDYIKLNMAKALSNNTKFYFSGENSPLGGLLSKLLN